MRDFYVRGLAARLEFPTNGGFPLLVVVPISDPRIDEKAGRIDLEDFTVTLELVDSVNNDAALFRGVVVLAAEPRPCSRSWPGIPET